MATFCARIDDVRAPPMSPNQSQVLFLSCALSFLLPSLGMSGSQPLLPKRARVKVIQSAYLSCDACHKERATLRVSNVPVSLRTASSRLVTSEQPVILLLSKSYQSSRPSLTKRKIDLLIQSIKHSITAR